MHMHKTLVCLSLVCLTAGLDAVTDATWNVDANGDWNNSGNWSYTSGSTFPNGVGDTANFGSVITGNRIVTLTGPVNVGTININNANNYTIASDTIAFVANLGGGAPSGEAHLTISNTGSPTISSSVKLNDNLELTQSSTGSLTISGVIFGTHALNKKGSGELILSAANTYSAGTVLSSGKIALSGAGALSPSGFVNLSNSGVIFDISAVAASGTATGTLLGASGSSIVLGAKALTSSQGSNGVFAGVMSGIGGSFIKEGSHTLTFTGANTYTGGTTVGRGRLNINGSILGPVTVGPSGILGGTGTITGDVTVHGTMSPGNSIGTAHITGSYTQSSGSTFEVELNPTSSDLLNVTGAPGTITINPGASARVVPDIATYPEQTIYTIMTATGGVSGTFSSAFITNFPPTLGVELIYHPTDVQLILRLLELVSAARCKNDRTVARTLQEIHPAAGTDLADVVAILRFLDIDAFNEGLSQLNPAFFKGITVSQQQNSFNVQKTFSMRMEERNVADCICIENSHRWSLWTDVFGDIARQSNTNCQAGYHATSGGAVLGSDIHLVDSLLVGAGLAYTYTDFDAKLSRGDGSLQSAYFSLYASWFNDFFFTNSSVTGAWMHIDGTRKIQFGSVDRRAKHTNEGGEFAAHLDLGFRLDPVTIKLQPFAALDYIYIHEGGYTESGARSLDLNVEDSDSQIFRSEGGLKVSRCFAIKSTKWVPEAKISQIYELRFQGKHYTARFRGESPHFTVSGYYPSRSLVGAGASLKGIFFKDRLSITLGYDGEFSGKYTDQMATLQAAYAF